MALGSNSRDFSRLFFSSSEELYSKKFYDAMDMESEDLHNYEGKCSNIIVNKEEKEKMIEICKKYLRFLDTSKIWSGVEYGYDVSLLLNYWLYEKLKNIYPDARNYEINIGFSALQLIWDTFDSRRSEESYYKKCKPNFNIFLVPDWNRRKQLYEYYIDLDILLGKAIISNPFCKKYYEQIKNFSPLYEYFRGECSHDEQKCPEFFHKFKKENLESKLKILPCHTEMEQAIALAADMSIDIPSHNHLGSERGPGAPVDGYRLSGSYSDIHYTPDHTEVHSKHAKHSVEYISDHSTSKSDTQLDNGNSGIGTKVTHSIFGAAPVLLTATALYRFTPLGPWMRGLLGDRTNSKNIMDAFSPYTQETSDMFSEDTSNYISYQPL